ncbi:MAG: Rrf2 family transcriptional regulator [Candidatus Pelethousia sp.]|nr:Rrf2 family transcriptional regulator [Candidatus Pelethousia sp.]
MRISSKGRYALAAVISMAQQYNGGESITVMSISKGLNLSKIYLEQVFSLLKRGGIVISIKGAQGGYQLARRPEQISVLAVLSAAELSVLERTEETVLEKAPDIEGAMRAIVFDELDRSLKATLESITLSDLVMEAEKRKDKSARMYYI